MVKDPVPLGEVRRALVIRVLELVTARTYTALIKALFSFPSVVHCTRV